MEFEEMQKIWNEQKGETMYAINESALHRQVMNKKRNANKIVNMTEIGLMIVNSITAIVLLVDAIQDKEEWYNYLGVGIMALTVVYIIFIRSKRQKGENKFDRTIIGELDHAIANTQSVINIGKTMIYWYLLPIGIFIISKMIYQNAPLEKWLLIIGAFVLGNFLANWEIKKCHIPRKESLEGLKRKLTEE
jgi:Ca2+/Na+ antiporter